jgi:hypothetical protein
MNSSAKISLYFLALGAALLLGGIAFQMVIGISLMSIVDESAERFGFALMSRGSIILITAYAMVFLSGIVFWLRGPYSLGKDRWFLAAFFCFYGWAPIDVYTIGLDLRFAALFNPNAPLTNELKSLFLSRQQSLGPIPLFILLAYLTAIGLMIYKPGIKKDERKTQR